MLKVPSLGCDDKKVIEMIGNEVQEILQEWTQGEITQVADQDMDAMEQSVQALQRLIGGRVIGILAEVNVTRQGDLGPVCPHCGRPLRLV
ncbi:MAG: hypothetical protein ACYDBH_22970 [Acidobacteriaceae bacterium]